MAGNVTGGTMESGKRKRTDRDGKRRKERVWPRGRERVEPSGVDGSRTVRGSCPCCGRAVGAGDQGMSLVYTLNLTT